MDIHIKNMVCDRCVMVVSTIFKEAGIDNANVQLGKVTVENPIDSEIFKQVVIRLKQVGFETINDSKSQLTEQIKTLAVDYVYQNKWDEKLNFSDYLVDRLHLDYPYLSTLFSSVEVSTIELLVYDEKTLSEIAWEMGYSSVGHLSGQFKRITGFRPSYFKNMKEQKRKPINDV